ncbi:BppU family phage baseplate upper protein [Bacillus sp. ISL-57]|uniref:BppU family phage baseplate upper protein n=1 Tax=Bacillus sp. ISL-57 TaxID=2819135 RepID=UPI001BECBBB8|nr:BppU family phage baseplate upper protein [Bacillus sp. ISL-57]MBT2717966.1 BppU family phage baseplate upper protein [Bacillus sp. ISL-57]
MANEIFKSGFINANVAASSSLTKTSIKFTTQDNGTAKLVFNINKENLPLPFSSAATAKIFLRMADGSTFEREASIIAPINGQVEYVLQEEISHPGLVNGELNIAYTNSQSLTVCQFTFEIERSLKDRDTIPNPNPGGGGSGGGTGINLRDITNGEIFTVVGSTPTPNTAPILTSSFVPVTIDDKTALSIPYTIADDKTASLTVTETKDGVSATRTVNKGANRWNVGLLSIGNHTLTLKVTDSGGLVSNTLTFSITVTLQVSNVPVTGVVLNQNTLTLTKGNTSQLTATVSPSNATNKAVTWSSSNTALATVNSSGLVTAVATGIAVITATTADGSFKATCTLTINEVVVTPPGPVTAEVYEDNGYLNMPITQYPWAGLTGYADASYIGMTSGSQILTALFDETTTNGDPVLINGYPFKPFVVGMPTSTYPYECVTIATTGSPIHRIILKVSTAHGATAAEIATYLQNSGLRMKIKLSTSYKVLTITPNIDSFETRTSGVVAGFEYVKFRLVDGIGDYVPTISISNRFFSSNGYSVVEAGSSSIHGSTKPSVRVNADGTMELVLTVGTLISRDAAGVVDYLTKNNLKIYYV